MGLLAWWRKGGNLSGWGYMRVGLLLACGMAAWIISASAYGQTVRSGFFSGNTLWESCQRRGPSDAPNPECMVYSIGVADSHTVSTPGWWCPPSNVTSGQVADVVSAYLRNHPEMRHYLAASTVALAIQEAFPCPPTGRR